MRSMGRRLSQFRDGGAMLETFEALRKKYPGDLEKHTLAYHSRRLGQTQGAGRKEG